MRVTYKKKNKKQKIKKIAKEIIYIPQDAGFFANYNTIVTHLMNKQKDNIFKVDLSTKHMYKNHDFRYDDGNKDINVWTEFFYQIPNKKHKNIIYEKQHTNRNLNRLIMNGDIQTARKKNDFSNFFYNLWKDRNTWRHQANQTVKKYIRLKEHIVKKIESFENKYMGNEHVIGVHVRHPLHYPDQPSKKMPEYEDYIRRIKENYDYKNAVIFLATDHTPPIKVFKKAFKDNLIYQEDVGRIAQIKCHREVHRRTPRLSLAEDVIKDCYLMAKCDSLVHVLSNVAFASLFINTDLKTDLLLV